MKIMPIVGNFLEIFMKIQVKIRIFAEFVKIRAIKYSL